MTVTEYATQIFPQVLSHLIKVRVSFLFQKDRIGDMPAFLLVIVGGVL